MKSSYSKRLLKLACLLCGMILILCCAGCAARSDSKDEDMEEWVADACSALTQIANGTNEIEAEYSDEDGFVPLDKADELLERVSEYAASLHQEGTITDYSYQPGDTCVYMQIDDWLGCLYDPPLYDVMSGGPEKAQIVTVESVLAPLDYLFSEFKGPDDTARMIEENDPSFAFTANYDKDDVTIETVQNLPSKSVIIWSGHGAYNSKIGSTLSLGGMTNDFLNGPSANYQSVLLLHQQELRDEAFCATISGGFCVTPKFFDKYMPENALSGSIVYLGSCYSYYLATYEGYEDSRLVDSILGLGASAVLGNTYKVNKAYNYKMIYSFFEGLTQQKDNGEFRTIEEALSYSKEENGIEDPINKSEVFAKLAKNADDFRLSDMLSEGQNNGTEIYGEQIVRGYYPGENGFTDCPITFDEAIIEERDVMIKEYNSGGVAERGFENKSVTFIRLRPGSDVIVPQNPSSGNPAYSKAINKGIGISLGDDQYEVFGGGIGEMEFLDGFFSGKAEDIISQTDGLLVLLTDQFDTDYCFIVMGPAEDGTAHDNHAADNSGIMPGIHNISVSAGNYHNGVLIDGDLYTWGYNSYGQLGDGTTEERFEPGLVSGLPKIKSICFAGQRSAAIAENGDLYAWGSTAGEVFNDGYEYHIPTKIEGISHVRQIDMDDSNYMALTDEGNVYIWGEDVSSPQEVDGLSNVKKICMGSGNFGAITEDGSLYTWSSDYGANEHGELGRKGISIYGGVSEMEPGLVESISKVTDIEFSGGYSAAVTEDGSLYLWGRGPSVAQVGDGSQSELHEPGIVPGIPPVKDVYFSGDIYALVTQDGKLYTWGENKYGSLGLGNQYETFYGSPTRVPELTGVKEVGVGSEHGILLTDDNMIYVFGDNSHGQLGKGDQFYSPIPIKVDFFSAILK